MERCGARLKSGRGRCKHEAGWGTEHVGVGRCKLHGGATPHGQVNGMVLLARREQAVMGMPLDIEPQDAIPGSPATGWRKPIVDRVGRLIGDDVKALLIAAT